MKHHYLFFIRRAMLLLLFFSALGVKAQQCAFDSSRAFFLREHPSWEGQEYAANLRMLAHINRNYRHLKPNRPLELQQLFENPGSSGSPSSPGVSYLDSGFRVIPVVFHIIHKTADASPATGTTNLPAEQIQSQVEALNQHFKPYYLKFCLAVVDSLGDTLAEPGITRVVDNARTYHFMNQGLDSLSQVAYFPSRRYLNIWVVDDIRVPGSPSLNPHGYTNFFDSVPERWDGVVIEAAFCGSNLHLGGGFLLDPMFQHGKVLVHEIGHWLGLYHTFQDIPGGTGCYNGDIALLGSRAIQGSIGDWCEDTPPCTQYEGCGPINTCHENYFLTGGADHLDPVDNFMGYTGEVCRWNFSDEQWYRMMACLDVQRTLLWSPANLIQTGVACVTNPWCYSERKAHCIGDTVKLTGVKAAGYRYKWKVNQDSVINFNNTFTHIATAADTLGTTVTLEMTDTALGVTLNFSSTDMVQVIDCTPIPSVKANWYFGQYSTLIFTKSGPYTPETAYDNRTVTSSSPNLSYSDSSGNMLFYGWKDNSPSSMTLVGADHTALPNTPLIGGGEGQQGIVIPMPGSSTQNFLVSMPAITAPVRQGVHYSLFDRTLGTQGDFVYTNRPVKIPAAFNYPEIGSDSAIYASSVITSASGCGDAFTWVILHGTEMDDTNDYNYSFLVFKLDASGIAYDSSYKFITPLQNRVVYDKTSYLKISPDGTKLATSSGSGYYLFDFDRETGAISNMQVLFEDASTIYSGGLTFSPNSRFLYTENRSIDTLSPLYNRFDNLSIRQYDLLQKDVALNYNLVRGDTADYLFNEFPSGMQLGPDGRIYATTDLMRANRIRIVNSPDLKQDISGKPNPGMDTKGIIVPDPLRTNPDILPVDLPNYSDATPYGRLDKTIRTRYISCDSVEFEQPYCGFLKWTFGNPQTGSRDTAYTKLAAHRFSKLDSNYTVKAYLNGDTISQQVLIGIPPFEILGRNEICDTGLILNFNSSLVTPELRYEWVFNNDTLPDSLPSVNLKWRTALDTLKLTITNSVSGCSRTVSKSLSFGFIDNYLTSGTFIDIDSVWADSIGGNRVPEPGIRYIWEYSTDGISWDSIPYSSDVPRLTAFQVDTPTYVRRVAYFPYISTVYPNPNPSPVIIPYNPDTLCLSKSNPVLLFDNTIYRRNVKCEINREVELYGTWLGYTGQNLVGISDVTWEYDLGSGFDWHPFTDTTTVINWILRSNGSLVVRMNHNVVNLRRKITGWGGAVGYSNVIQYTFDSASLTRPLTNTVVCQSGGTASFNFAIDNIYGDTYWYLKRGGSSSYALAKRGGSSFSYTTTSGLDFDSVYCDILLPCGGYTFRTNIGVVFKDTASPTISTQPVFMAASDEGDTLMFFVETTPQSFSAFYSWRKSPDGFFWQDIPNSNNDTLFYMGDACEDGWQVQVLISNTCGSVISMGNSYIDIQALADLSIRDNLADVGTEPNGIYGTWNSPDIWNRLSNDGIKAHQAPLFSNGSQNWTTPYANYLYVDVINRGAATSPPSELYLYWSRLSSGQIWDKSWRNTTGNTIFSPMLGADIPLGDMVNGVPAMVPSIAPGDTERVMVEWFPPNPFWYGEYIKFQSNNTSIYNRHSGAGIEQKLCYLARIAPCDYSPFGMTTAETYSQLDNVRNNNNIAVRNVEYRRLKPDEDVFTGQDQNPNVRTVWVNLQNPEEQDTVITITVTKGTSFNFDLYGNVYLYFDDVLDSLFQLYGSISGATTTGYPGVYLMTSSTVTISDIPVVTGLQAHLGVDFEIINTMMPEFSDSIFIAQHVGSTNNFNGGSSIVAYVEQILAKKAENQSYSGITEESRQNASFGIYPNPNTGTVYMQVELPTKQEFSARLLDGLGREVSNMERPALASGIYLFSFDMNNLASGIYYVEMRSGDIVKMEKVILQK